MKYFQLYEAFALNTENYTSPLFYQIAKISNGYKFTFGLSQDQNVAKQKKISIDLLKVDEKFMTALIETCKKFLKDTPTFDTAKLKEMILKVYKDHEAH